MHMSFTSETQAANLRLIAAQKLLLWANLTGVIN